MVFERDGSMTEPEVISVLSPVSEADRSHRPCKRARSQPSEHRRHIVPYIDLSSDSGSESPKAGRTSAAPRAVVDLSFDSPPPLVRLQTRPAPGPPHRTLFGAALDDTADGVEDADLHWGHKSTRNRANVVRTGHLPRDLPVSASPPDVRTIDLLGSSPPQQERRAAREMPFASRHARRARGDDLLTQPLQRVARTQETERDSARSSRAFRVPYNPPIARLSSRPPSLPYSAPPPRSQPAPRARDEPVPRDSAPLPPPRRSLWDLEPPAGASDTSDISDELLACRLQEQEEALLQSQLDAAAWREQALLQQQREMEELRREVLARQAEERVLMYEALMEEALLGDFPLPDPPFPEGPSDFATRHRAPRSRPPMPRARDRYAPSLIDIAFRMSVPPSLLMGPRHRRGSGPHQGLESIQEALAGAARAGLPPHLLFSDRDFTADDYEWLCKLDDTVESRKAAPKQVIDSMPCRPVPPGGLREANGERQSCAVCLESYQEGEQLRELPCTHCFHKDCIDKWLGQKATCPVCQRDCR